MCPSDGLTVWLHEWVRVGSWCRGYQFARSTLPLGLPLNFQVCVSFHFNFCILKKIYYLFVSSGLDCLCWTVAAHCAPMDTHDIATKPSPQLMVLRHGALFRLLPHYHPNEKAECLCGWMESRGGSGMAGRTINPLCGLSEFWSLRCCAMPVPLASSVASVTVTACQAGLTCSSKAQEALFFTRPLSPPLLIFRCRC